MSNDTNASGDVLKSAKKIMSAIEGIVEILGPLQSDERHRAIQGALVVLREGAPNSEDFSGSPTRDSGVSIDTPPRGKLWIKQNGITSDHLLQVFDISDGAATVIAAQLSGKNNAEKAIKAYVLTGIAALLISGESNFSDKAARKLCETFGCYDSTNHSKYLKEKNNYLVGDKDKGWKLTAPGLKYAGITVKELAGLGDAG